MEVSLVNKPMTPSICWANYLVGVIIKHKALFGSVILSEKFNKSDMIGAAKAKVFPEPVCEAMRKS